MRLPVLLATFLLLGPLLPVPPVLAQDVVGVLAGDQHWSGEVTLTGDVLVPVGCSLTIAAGTTVRVTPAESTRIDPEFLSSGTELLVRGTLTVAGTADAPVRFVASGPGGDDFDYGWAGIILDHAYGSSVAGARITAAETGLLVIGCSPNLTGNHIAGSRYGVVVQQGGAPKILDNRIEDGEGGIFCWDGSRPYLKGNVIRGQGEEGIYVDRWSRPWLDRNQVSGNDLGLVLGAADLPADMAGIKGNRVDRLLLGERP